MRKGYKLCPFCKGEIKEEAIKCRFCAEFLEEQDKEGNTKDVKEKIIENKKKKKKEIAENCYDGEGCNDGMFDKDGYDKDGYDKEGFDRNGKHCNGIYCRYKCKCGERIRIGDEKCSKCGAELTREKKITTGDKLLFLVPNMIVLYFCLSFFWVLIGTIDVRFWPKYSIYKTEIYQNAFSVFMFFSIFIPIFGILATTKKKIWVLSWFFLFIVFVGEIFAYITVRSDYSSVVKLREHEAMCKEKGYDNCSEMWSKMGQQLEKIKQIKQFRQ